MPAWPFEDEQKEGECNSRGRSPRKGGGSKKKRGEEKKKAISSLAQSREMGIRRGDEAKASPSLLWGKRERGRKKGRNSFYEFRSA